jgi:CubicO group peptidase (beta-lactamase class C family)
MTPAAVLRGIEVRWRAALATSVFLSLAACGANQAHRGPGLPEAGSSVFPGPSWEQATSVETLGWSATRVAALKAAIDSLGSSVFMIVTRGKVVAAWGDTARTYRTHSVRKSFMSALVGMAAAEGRIDTAATLGALGIEEKGVTLTVVERQATVGDLLRARSGVYLAAAGEIDAMRNARPARGSHPPGTHWYYNNWGFNVLGTIFRRQTGEDIYLAIDRRIARPLGMQDYRPDEGSYGLEEHSLHPSYPFRISARDLARFGVLYLSRGRWGQSQLIPASWIDASVRSYSPSGDQGSSATHSGYGFMWWIQMNAAAHPELRIPDGSFTASGLGGQLMTVIPEIETVIVNLMNTDEPGPRIRTDQWDRLLGIVLAARLQ